MQKTKKRVLQQFFHSPNLEKYNLFFIPSLSKLQRGELHSLFRSSWMVILSVVPGVLVIVLEQNKQHQVKWEDASQPASHGDVCPSVPGPVTPGTLQSRPLAHEAPRTAWQRLGQARAFCAGHGPRTLTAGRATEGTAVRAHVPAQICAQRLLLAPAMVLAAY